MAYTVAQVINRALKRIFVLGAGETTDAEDSADGLEAYNAMMFGFEADGLTLHDESDVTYSHAAQALSASFPLADKHFEGVSALLAQRLAPDYGAEISAALAIDIQAGMNRMYADFFSIGEVSFDGALTRLPSQADKF